ncbi:MAG: PIN domain-containing protein [Bacteroidia bacterium]|nr:PIN domain-containing protein [Bacteroidia bacterium]MDW8347685.1 PIN domain-containing protein [Bacteroidia bacterium]
MKILIDTDVLLDLLLDRKPFSENAAKVLSLCEKNKIQGFVTAVTINNLYYILRKSTSHKDILTAIEKLLLIVDIPVTDKLCIERALKSGFKDFEDAIQNCTADCHLIQTIITRNTKDYKKSRLNVLTPDRFLETI